MHIRYPRGYIESQGVVVVFFIGTLESEGLGHHRHRAGGPRHAVVPALPRDIDRGIAAARRGTRTAHGVESHAHNDRVTGGPEPARVGGARCPVPAGAAVPFARTPVADGDTFPVDEGLTLRHRAGGMRAATAASPPGAAGREVVAVDDGFDAAAAAAGPALAGVGTGAMAVADRANGTDGAERA
ncbi:hypothetical protein, partial [Streptomyces clavuligerus]